MTSQKSKRTTANESEEYVIMSTEHAPNEEKMLAEFEHRLTTDPKYHEFFDEPLEDQPAGPLTYGTIVAFAHGAKPETRADYFIVSGDYYGERVAQDGPPPRLIPLVKAPQSVAAPVYPRLWDTHVAMVSLQPAIPLRLLEMADRFGTVTEDQYVAIAAAAVDYVELFKSFARIAEERPGEVLCPELSSLVPADIEAATELDERVRKSIQQTFAAARQRAETPVVRIALYLVQPSSPERNVLYRKYDDGYRAAAGSARDLPPSWDLPRELFDNKPATIRFKRLQNTPGYTVSVEVDHHHIFLPLISMNVVFSNGDHVHYEGMVLNSDGSWIIRRSDVSTVHIFVTNKSR